MEKTQILSTHTPIYHLSYFVEDVEEASRTHHAMFGSGPFMVMKDIETEPVYKGEKLPMHFSMSTGWWGELAVEFVAQHNDGPSYLKDNGRFGFHHVCLGVSDVKKVMEEVVSFGCEVAMYDLSRETHPYAYIDARNVWGMYIEINPGPDPVYKAVKEWAVGWDGETKVLRYMDDLQAYFDSKK